MKLFVTRRFYIIASTLVAGFVIAYFLPWLFPVMKAAMMVFVVLTVADLLLLFFTNGRLTARREVPERFSNGDENSVRLLAESTYNFKVDAYILDELPEQFQMRHFGIPMPLGPRSERVVTYQIKPVKRGEYQFGNINLLCTTSLKLLIRRFVVPQAQTVKVYPSFMQLKKYELMAFSQQQTIEGQRKLKRIGHSMEFDHIKDYTPGDDPRHINWQATARRGHLMINYYVEEKSQAIYSVIDKSRPMKMPFEQMTLLDYAINASLAISDIALKKGDRAGLVTFHHKTDTMVPAGKGPHQMYQMMESLYHEKTDFTEHNFAMLYARLTARIASRSLLLVFSNFESLYSMERQLKYIKLLNRKHLVLLVLFRNTELDSLIHQRPADLREVYHQAIAKNMSNEKYAIIHTLRQNGILSLYTTPQSLTTDVINKYLELKSRRMI